MGFDSLSVRARNVLRYADIYGQIRTPNQLRSAAALAGKSVEWFLRGHQNCGKKTIAEIMAWCGESAKSTELDKAHAEIKRLASVAHGFGRKAGYSEDECAVVIGYVDNPQP